MSLETMTPFLWNNPRLLPAKQALALVAETMTPADMDDAALRLQRFAPCLAQLFPETARGIIESPLRRIDGMATVLRRENPGWPASAPLLIKLDSHLPIAGSIKARGGVYEVLVHAEHLARQAGLLAGDRDDDYRVLLTAPARELFAQHRIEVGSTGNLGLSIGITAAAFGFGVTVHMSRDARQWKKDLLRSKGVQVREYAADYSQAVIEGRLASQTDEKSYFVDDENSRALFLGYAVAALRLPEQLAALGVTVDEQHPLQVYLPCGVGGGPGGVTFGLKHVFGDAVRCWFAEPTHAPAVLAGLITGLHERICVQDLGIDNRTAADGLAVGRPSGMVCRIMDRLLDGGYTVEDQELFRLLALLDHTEALQLEPSALAGMAGPRWIARREGETHLVWATGGSMVPAAVMREYLSWTM